MMENSNLSFRIWYLAMLFMTFTKNRNFSKGTTASIKSQQIRSLRSLLHRIRNAIWNRDNMYTLSDMVEFDEGYYEIATAENIKLKRGKGSQKQRNVAVMAESIPLDNIETGKKVRVVGTLK